MSSLLFCAAVLLLCTPLAGAGESPDFERALSFAARTEHKVFRADFKVHWLPDGRLWYSVLTAPEQREWVLADPATAKAIRAGSLAELHLPEAPRPPDVAADRSPASDEEVTLELRNARADTIELLWLDSEGQRHSYGRLESGARRSQHTFLGHVWVVLNAAGQELLRFAAEPSQTNVVITPEARPKPEPRASQQGRSSPETSPDGQWEIHFAGHQMLLRHLPAGDDTVLTVDGTAQQPYRGPVRWSPDGQHCVALSVHEVPRRRVTEVESSPSDQLQPKVHSFEYLKPGDDLPMPQPVLLHLANHSVQRIDRALSPTPFTPDGELEINWAPDSAEFTFDYNQRGHQLYRILAVDAHTAAVRTVVEETSPTFIDYTNKTWRHFLPKTGELLWMSEREGWCHLWLYDAAKGEVKNRVTQGQWVVREVLHVDEEQRLVWFMASGLRPEEDPYHLHLCRAAFDGTGFRQLTSGDGHHAIEFSPDRRCFIDRWSRVDLPPVAELRRSEDGQLLCVLELADATALLATGWTLPERFSAKGRDGHTDIHGLLIKPSGFQADQHYPVLEEVYAGPHGAFVPRDFSRLARQHALAELGFIVVQADGMGTNHRGKAFHDVAWQHLEDAGFPDRIAWIKAAATTRPWMDLTRVGIYGGSAGGQDAMRALLDHHDFYRAAFADCGCHDNRMDKIWWNEQWLGWPIGDAYRRASNVVDAPKLEGALMLCVAELDHNVDPSSTMQVVNALEKAGKDFELLVITGAGHGAAETPYGSRRRMDFFARHLLPNR